jgi:hypothetical protein
MQLERGEKKMIVKEPYLVVIGARRKWVNQYYGSYTLAKKAISKLNPDKVGSVILCKFKPERVQGNHNGYDPIEAWSFGYNKDGTSGWTEQKL